MTRQTLCHEMLSEEEDPYAGHPGRELKKNKNLNTRVQTASPNKTEGISTRLRGSLEAKGVEDEEAQEQMAMFRQFRLSVPIPVMVTNRSGGRLQCEQQQQRRPGSRCWW